MADKNNRLKSNVPGKYYVTNECISCGICADEAPNCFKEADDGLYIVSKQPSTSEEEAECSSALNSCPVDAIGSDG